MHTDKEGDTTDGAGSVSVTQLCLGACVGQWLASGVGLIVSKGYVTDGRWADTV
jgi:hypothetical protein